MAELGEQLTQMLQDPQIMQQVIAMAQSFGMNPPRPDGQAKTNPPSDAQPVSQTAQDMLQRMNQFAALPMLDSNQKGLLNALSPYLSKEKSQKLENAMAIAHLATMASITIPGKPPEVK